MGVPNLSYDIDRLSSISILNIPFCLDEKQVNKILTVHFDDFFIDDKFKCLYLPLDKGPGNIS